MYTRAPRPADSICAIASRRWRPRRAASLERYRPRSNQLCTRQKGRRPARSRSPLTSAGTDGHRWSFRRPTISPLRSFVWSSVTGRFGRSPHQPLGEQTVLMRSAIVRERRPCFLARTVRGPAKRAIVPSSFMILAIRGGVRCAPGQIDAARSIGRSHLHTCRAHHKEDGTMARLPDLEQFRAEAWPSHPEIA